MSAAIAVGSDQVGVEGHHVAGLDLAVAALVEPGVGARARSQQSRLDPLAAAGDVGLVQLGPELQILGDAGLEVAPHRGHAGFTGMHRPAHRLELLGMLDPPCLLARLLAGDRLDAFRTQHVDAQRLALVDREPPVAAAMRRDQVRDLPRPGPSPAALLLGRAGVHVEPCGRRADLSHQREVGADVHGLGIVE